MVVFADVPSFPKNHRMKGRSSNYLGDYSYSFYVSSSFVSLQLQFPSSFDKNTVTEDNSPQGLSSVARHYNDETLRDTNLS